MTRKELSYEYSGSFEPPGVSVYSNKPSSWGSMLFATFGGSHSYGTNVEGSDIDIRGCAFNSKTDLLGRTNFEQVIDNATDTTIYSFNKLIGLLENCNPNTIEMLGCRPESYMFYHPIGNDGRSAKNVSVAKGSWFFWRICYTAVAAAASCSGT